MNTELNPSEKAETKHTLANIVLRKAIDIRKEVFYFVLNNDDFVIDDLFIALNVKEKEKVHIYNYLKELCYFNFIQGIKSRYIKVNIKG